MGRGRRAQGTSGRLSRRFDLRGEAAEFADELSGLLNRTVSDGIRLSAVTDPEGQQARIGYGITATSLVPRVVPLAFRGTPHLYLGLLYRMGPDDAGKYPMIRSSVMYLSPDADGSRTLLHYDYERDKDDYPEAHLQVCATSDAWQDVTRRYGPKGRPLERLHLPVGGRRYRPSIEDLIEFLITEQLAAGRRGWEKHVREGRSRFEERQLRAAVRRNPDAAMSILRQEGHIN